MAALNKKLLVRSISALIAIPIVLLSLYLGGAYFYILVAIIGFILSFEIGNLTIIRLKNIKKDKSKFIVSIFFSFLAISLILLSILSLLNLYDMEDGKIYLFEILIAVWVVDISAYFIGSTLKGPKLLPSISPNKTISGLLGAILTLFLLIYFTHAMNIAMSMIIAIKITLIAQAGDLLESWYKRKVGVKDSGNFMPGHGGLLDRLDGLIAILILLAIESFMV